MAQPQYKTHRPVTVHIEESLIDGCDQAAHELGMKSRTQFINYALSRVILETLIEAKQAEGRS